MRMGTASRVHLCRPATATPLTMEPRPWAAAAQHNSCMHAPRIHGSARARITPTVLQAGTAPTLSPRAGHGSVDHVKAQPYPQPQQYLPTGVAVARWVRGAARETTCGSARPHPNVAHARDTKTVFWACTVRREAFVARAQKGSTLLIVQVSTMTVARLHFWKCIVTTHSFQL